MRGSCQPYSGEICSHQLPQKSVFVAHATRQAAHEKLLAGKTSKRTLPVSVIRPTALPSLLCGGIILWGHFGIARSVRLSVPWRSCLGYRHAGCLQLSHCRPPETCGLRTRTRPRTDVDPRRFLDPWTDADGLIGGETICHCRTAVVGGSILSRRPRLRPGWGAFSNSAIHPSVCPMAQLPKR